MGEIEGSKPVEGEKRRGKRTGEVVVVEEEGFEIEETGEVWYGSGEGVVL